MLTEKVLVTYPDKTNRAVRAESERKMILKAFAIRDSKGEMFNTPFFQKTHGEAERSFREVVKDERSLPSKYPEDFDLYYLGEFNDLTGQIISLDTPQHVVKAINLQIQDSRNPMMQGGQTLHMAESRN